MQSHKQAWKPLAESTKDTERDCAGSHPSSANLTAGGDEQQKDQLYILDKVTLVNQMAKKFPPSTFPTSSYQAGLYLIKEILKKKNKLSQTLTASWRLCGSLFSPITI